MKVREIEGNWYVRRVRCAAAECAESSVAREQAPRQAPARRSWFAAANLEVQFDGVRDAHGGAR